MSVLGRVSGSTCCTNAFSARMLALTRPRKRPLVTALYLGLATLALSLVAATPVFAWFALSGELHMNREGLERWAIGALLLAPLLETAILVIFYHIAYERWGLGMFAGLCVGFFAALHLPAQGAPIAAAVMFFIWSHQYVSYRIEVGKRLAFWAVALSHFAYNAVVIAATFATEALGIGI